MRTLRLMPVLGILSAGLVCVPAVAEDDKRFEVGLRTILVTAGGEPANDMMSGGVYGEWHFSDSPWFVGAAVDSYTHDFERPWLVVGLQQDSSVETIDSTGTATVVSAWGGREYGQKDRGLRWFWTAGLGFTSPDADDVTGPLEGGGTFDITTDPGSETIVSASAGLRKPLGQRWSFQFALRADHHLADWAVTDRTSSNTGRIDDYTGLGGAVALGVRF